jgi:hypothetical protein
MILAALAGQALKAVFAVILLVRRPRPVHASGVMLAGTVRWLPRIADSGIRWIDAPPGEPVAVVARVSRAIGLPAPLPDVIGLAIRFHGDDGPTDLELSSTGFGVPSRFWLAPQRSPSRARFTTLLPYRSTTGPIVVAARTIDPPALPVPLGQLARALEAGTWNLRLYYARPTGKWRPFADLELTRTTGPVDGDLRFDAVRNPLPGAGTYAWTRALREPSYRLAQD